MENEKVDVEITLDDDILFQLMMEAHKQDITFNQYVENAIKKYIENEKEE